MRMRRYGWLGLVCVLAVSCATVRDAGWVRPEAWAQRVEREGVPNLHRVSESLYRSAQPSSEGMKNLERMGIKTVVNLRSLHSDRDEMRGTSLGYEHLPMEPWNPSRVQVVEFLRIATDEKKAPVLVHCQRGSDRTGALCAMYRVAVQGWTKEEALREMTQGGFGFHRIWRNLPEWVEEQDVAALQRDAGLTSESASAVPKAE